MSHRTCQQVWWFLCRLTLGNKSGNTSVERRLRAQGTAIGPHEGTDTPSELRLYPATALIPKTFVARFRARNRATQTCDLRKRGAPKGIRILIVLVTVGDYWDSLVQRSCGESQ